MLYEFMKYLKILPVHHPGFSNSSLKLCVYEQRSSVLIGAFTKL